MNIGHLVFVLVNLFITDFESRANFIDLSFLQVITIGLINLSSSQFPNFLKCSSDFSLFDSVFTESSKCNGTRLPFS